MVDQSLLRRHFYSGMKKNRVYGIRLKYAAALGMLLLFLPFVVWSQARFSASAPKSVAVNQNFQYNLTLENANASNLKPPSFSDFQLLGGPNTSTSMQWINGNVSQSVTYSYILRPKKEGTFKIGKASVTVAGVNMESNEVNIEVGKPVAQQPQQQQRQRNPMGWDPFEDDPFFNPQAQQEPEVSEEELQKQIKDDVFIKVNVSRNNVYKGEMLTATYKLYFRHNLSGFNVTKAPAFDGFWSQEVTLDANRTRKVETINGKQYYTVDIMKYNLYPQRDGSLTIPPAEVNAVAQVQVRSRSRGFFDDFFGMGRMAQVPLTLKTGSATVAVKELPEKGKPEDYNGAVGKYTYEARLSGKEAKTDEPITYTVKISGTGNLKFIDAPTLELPEEFEVYDPKVKENISNGADGLSGTKQYDYLIIPRQPGEYKINANTFSYFDPATGKYVTLSSPEFTVNVTGTPSQNPNLPVVTEGDIKKPVAVLDKDIRYIKTTVPSFAESSSFLASPGFVALYATPFLLFAGLLWVRRRNETLAADVIGTRRRKALKNAKARLSTAEKFLAKSDKKNFYTEMSLALWGYVSHKLAIEMAELSKENVEEKLLACGVAATTIQKLKNLITTCEQALYAPVGEGGEMKLNYEAAMNLIADLEDEIKKPQPANATAGGFFSTFIFLLLVPALFAQTPEQLYTKGAQLYKAQNYAEAISTYEKLLSSGHQSAEVYYNLGNSYYKTGETARCILNYERALRISPADEDVLHNIALARLQLKDKITPVPQLPIVTYWNSWVQIFSSGRWAVVAASFLWAALLACALYLFLWRSKAVLYAGVLLLFLSVAHLSLAAVQRSNETDASYAIVMDEKVNAKNAPDNNGTTAFELHTGTKFKILDQLTGWHKIRLADGRQAWLPSGTFVVI